MCSAGEVCNQQSPLSSFNDGEYGPRVEPACDTVKGWTITEDVTLTCYCCILVCAPQRASRRDEGKGGRLTTLWSMERAGKVPCLSFGHQGAPDVI